MNATFSQNKSIKTCLDISEIHSNREQTWDNVECSTPKKISILVVQTHFQNQLLYFFGNLKKTPKKPT